VAEDGAPTDTALGFDDVMLSPHTVGAITCYSRRTMINASPSIEQIVRNDLVAVIARANDDAAMLSDGSANRPTGIIHTSGVTEISLSRGATWPLILSFPATIRAPTPTSGPGLGDEQLGRSSPAPSRRMPRWAWPGS
jgi:hypothetical protein